MEFFATTAKGVEAILAAELQRLGIPDIREETGGVGFSGDLTSCYKANLWLRTANRILVTIHSFECYSEHELYEGISAIDWAQYMSQSMTLAVDANVRDSTITHSKYAALKTKDAIVDQFRDRSGSRPDVDVRDPDLRINIHIARNICSVSLDASGDSLHKRGYRDMNTPTPLKETLAAALVELTEWDGRVPFIDPMCGSGTIIIEAAMKAANIAPGLLRKQFGFERWPMHDRNRWQRIRAEVKASIVNSGADIRGSDVSAMALDAARRAVQNAGIDKMVKLQVAGLDKIVPPPQLGIVIVNPPYGVRLGDQDQLAQLYKQIGDVFKTRFTGYTGYVFTGNLELAKKIGLRASKRHILFNGPIESRLIRFELY